MQGLKKPGDYTPMALPTALIDLFVQAISSTIKGVSQAATAKYQKSSARVGDWKEQLEGNPFALMFHSFAHLLKAGFDNKEKDTHQVMAEEAPKALLGLLTGVVSLFLPKSITSGITQVLSPFLSGVKSLFGNLLGGSSKKEKEATPEVAGPCPAPVPTVTPEVAGPCPAPAPTATPEVAGPCPARAERAEPITHAFNQEALERRAQRIRQQSKAGNTIHQRAMRRRHNHF